MSIPNALLSWANTFLDFDAQVDGYDQFSDGTAIADIVDQITPGVVDCQASANEIFAAVLINTYGTDSIATQDLCAGNADALAELLGALLIAAIQSDGRDMVIRGITQLDGGVQVHLKAVIEGAVIVTAATSEQAAANRGASPLLSDEQRGGHQAGAGGAAGAAAEEAGEEDHDDDAAADAAAPSAEHQNGFNSTAVFNAQKEHMLAEEHMRKRLTTVQEELDDAYALHDEVLLELQGKNKEIDELQFRVQDTEHAVDRVKVLEEELESLQGMEIKFVKMKADSERFKQALDEAKPRLQELASLQKDHNSVTSANREQTDKIQVLEARVKEYRVRVSSSELKLSELRASMERKDVEMKRLLESRNTLGDEVKTLKVKITTLEGRLTNQEAEIAAGAGTTNDGQIAEAERLVHLEEECARLRTELSSNQEFDIKKCSLEDRIADGAAFADGLESKIKSQAGEIHEHRKVLEDKDAEIEQLQYKLAAVVKEKDAEIEQLNAARSHQTSEVNQLRAQLQKLSHENGTAKVSMKHMEAQLRMSKKQDEQASRRLSFVPKVEEAPPAPAEERPRRTYHNPTPSWWGENAGPNHPSNSTDADRIAELKRRNKARQPHLRSSHALEMQDQQTAASFFDTMQKSAYTVSPKPASPPQAFRANNSAYKVQPSSLISQIFNPAALQQPTFAKQAAPAPAEATQAAGISTANAPVEAPDVELQMPKGQAFAVTSEPVSRKMPPGIAKRMAEAKAKKDASIANAARQKDIKDAKEKEKAAKAKAKKKAGNKHSNVQSNYSSTGRVSASATKTKSKTTKAAATAAPPANDENVAQSNAKAGISTIQAKKGGLKVPGSESRRRSRQLPASPMATAAKTMADMGLDRVHRGLKTPTQALNATAKDPFSCTVRSSGKATPLRSRLNIFPQATGLGLVDYPGTPI